MQTVNEDTIKHIAKLSKIALKNEDIPVLAKQIGQILEYVEQLNEIPDNIEPLDNLTGNFNRFREDVVVDFKNKEKIISNAPKNKNGFILVPKVLEN